VEEQAMELLTSTTAFALLVTKLVDFTRNMFDKDQHVPKWVWNALPLGLGLIMALVFDLDVFRMFEHNGTAEWAGRILTGLGIGATGSGWHEVLDALSGTAKVTHASGPAKVAAIVGASNTADASGAQN
jgi:hypothetical protein